MKPDWNYVKKSTLWGYEELLEKLQAVLTYPLIFSAYNQSMPQAIGFARCLFETSNVDNGEFPAPLIASLGKLQAIGVRNWSDLLEKVATRESCISFIERNQLGFEELIDVLRYVLRWAFPFYTGTRELLDRDNPEEMKYYPVFKAHHLMCSFDLLEHGYTKAKRAALAKQTGLPLDFLTQLIHRANIARLPYVRRKTILPVCGAGYDTLAKIAAADLSTMDADMARYFKSLGKSWDDFKSVIVLRGLITGAKALPRIVRS